MNGQKGGGWRRKICLPTRLSISDRVKISTPGHHAKSLCDVASAKCRFFVGPKRHHQFDQSKDHTTEVRLESLAPKYVFASSQNDVCFGMFLSKTTLELITIYLLFKKIRRLVRRNCSFPTIQYRRISNQVPSAMDKFHVVNIKCRHYRPHFFAKRSLVIFVFNKK